MSTDYLTAPREWCALQRAHGIASATAAERDITGIRPDIGAIWLACDVANEQGFWSDFQQLHKDLELLTWTGTLVTNATSEGDPAAPRGTKDASTTYSPRLGLPGLAMMKGMAFTRRTSSEVPPGESLFTAAKARSSSGFAAALAVRGESQATIWQMVTTLMETHFHLKYDFKNSPSLTQRRGEIVGAYVNLAIEFGLAPILPLNGHPSSGFAMFCHGDNIDFMVDRLAPRHHCKENPGRISRFLYFGGGFSYL